MQNAQPGECLCMSACVCVKRSCLCRVCVWGGGRGWEHGTAFDASLKPLIDSAGKWKMDESVASG